MESKKACDPWRNHSGVQFTVVRKWVISIFIWFFTTNNLAQAHQHKLPIIACMWGFKTLILLVLNLFLIFRVYKLFINCLYYLFTVSVYLQILRKHKLNSWSPRSDQSTKKETKAHQEGTKQTKGETNADHSTQKIAQRRSETWTKVTSTETKLLTWFSLRKPRIFNEKCCHSFRLKISL